MGEAAKEMHWIGGDGRREVDEVRDGEQTSRRRIQAIHLCKGLLHLLGCSLSFTGRGESHLHVLSGIASRWKWGGMAAPVGDQALPVLP